MKNLPRNHPGELVLYETEDSRKRFVADTLWLSQAGMAELFHTSKLEGVRDLFAR